MKIKLTEAQKELVDLAKKKGFLTMYDAMAQYSNVDYAKNIIRRLVILGLLKESEIPGRFIYTGERNMCLEAFGGR